MSKELLRSKIFQKTGCTRLCFFLGGIGASLTIGATSLTYLFLHEQLEFTASLLANEEVSAACGAINSLAFGLLEGSLHSEETRQGLPAWMLATGLDTADGIRWVSPPPAELVHNVARITQQQVVHAGNVPTSPTTEVERTEFAHKVRHSVPVNACTLEGIQKNGEGRAVPVAFDSIPGEDRAVLLATLTEKGVALSQNNRRRFAIINLSLMLDSLARNENKAMMSGWLTDRKDWLQINTALSTYPVDHMEDLGNEHIHYLLSSSKKEENQIETEAGLYQFVLLTSDGLEVIYEAWVDYSLLDRLPKRIAGLIFIVGLMSSGVGVMMSRTALVKEAKISDELRRQSRTDSLTELPNRRAWDELLVRENNALQRHRGQYAIAVIDLDHFKGVNDSLGHAAGDALLRRTAQVLNRIIRSEDVAARVGGDEFTVLFREPTDQRDDQLLDRLETAFADEEIDISIGLAFSQPDQPLMDAWNQADGLMYSHKSSKKAGR